jgi:hypothetical protein
MTHNLVDDFERKGVVTHAYLQHEECIMNAGVVCVVGVRRLRGMKKEETG